MAYILFFIALAYLMAGGNHNKGSSTLSKQRDKISRRSGAQNLFERNETLLKEYFYNNVIVYGNLIDVEDLNHHNPGFTELVEAQRWEMAMISALEIKVALSQIHKFYYTLNKINSASSKPRLMDKSPTSRRVLLPKSTKFQMMETGHTSTM